MINEFENILREIIIYKLGLNPISYNITQDRIEKWNEKNKIDNKRNPNIKENRIIYYSDFYDLKTIILKNWEVFLPVFLDKKRFEVFFDELERYKNTIAHGRELLKSQKLLLEGILLDLKNIKAIYHNKNEMKDDYFIRINKVSDNLGNIWTSSINHCKKPLRVGDNYEKIIKAVDPKNREIEYEIFMSPKFRITQKNNHINFEIKQELISSLVSLSVIARTPNSECKNQTQFSIVYTIIPK
jgi:hypothetical protein